MVRNTLVCEWVTLVTSGIYDFESGLKNCLDVDLFGSFVYLRGVWEKVRVEAITGLVGFGADF